MSYVEQAFDTEFDSIIDHDLSLVGYQKLNKDPIEEATIDELKEWLLSDCGYTNADLQAFYDNRFSTRQIARLAEEQGHSFPSYRYS